ncbi:hypothetical protein RB195_008675 [Necator americanus]
MKRSTSWSHDLLRKFGAFVVIVISSLYLSLFTKPTITTIRKTSLSERQFASLIASKYGNERILDGPICMMDGLCLVVKDFIWEHEGRTVFTRDLGANSISMTTMNLKMPQKLDKANLDTSKWEVDQSSLDFTSYTITMIEEMFASGTVKIDFNADAQVLMIGIGGGYIDSYLHKVYPKMNVTAVDMDQKMVDVAIKWFGLKMDNRHHVVVENGVEFVENAVSRGAKFDVIHIDACTTEKNVDTNCPVNIFYTEESVRNFATLLNPRGAVIVNVVTIKGDQIGAAEKVKKAFGKAFTECTYEYAPFSPSNIIMTCTQFQRPHGLKERYQKLMNYSTPEQT